jgi:hypothetical protein
MHTPKPRDTSNWDIREGVYRVMGSSVASNWTRTSCELEPVKGDLRRFRLTFSKNASWTGLKGEEGAILRQLYIQHSKSAEEPWWEVCEDQSGISRVNYEEVVKGFALAHIDWTQRKIADTIGCSLGVVNKYYPKHGKQKAALKIVAKKGEVK